MKEITLIVGIAGLLLSVIAVTAAIIDRRNRRRT
jgi:hypothetical protein